LPQPNDSQVLFEEIKIIVMNSQPIVIKRDRAEAILAKIQFEIELDEKRPFLLSLYNALTELISHMNYSIDKIEHYEYRERYHFLRENEKAVIDFEYDGQGLFGRVLPLDSASNSQDLISDVKSLIQQLKTNQNVF
jgi:hypothetical protein